MFNCSGKFLYRLAALLAVMSLSACSLVPSGPDSVDDPVVVTPTDTQPATSATPKPAPAPKPAALPPVAVVITSKQPAFMDVANALTEHLDDFEVFDLSDGSQPPVSVLRKINDSETGAVVAIGLRAAQSSVAMSRVPVIFSQVFNYQDHDLIGENSRGVAPLAPLDAQLAAWKQFDPAISRIGIIVGAGHEALVEEAQLAAEKHHVELQVKIATSDQETIYLFRRMAQDIDGFWLFPDNRVLSGRSLQEILTTAKRHQVAIAVQNEAMLKMGANISMSTEAEDIAATIAGILRSIHARGLASIPPLSPLSAIRVVTRDAGSVVQR